MFTGNELTATQLFTFLKKYSKIHILAPGCDEKLDKLSDNFMSEETKRKDILKQAEEFVAKIECEEVENSRKLINTFL
jgi:uncharacterized protein YaaR (DUF327 family)